MASKAAKVTKDNLERYLSEARSWETDKVKAIERSRKTAWVIASFAGLLSLFAVLAVAMLSPLKSVQPYVVRVDNATGAVDIVNALTGTPAKYDEAVNKYFLQNYVRWREGYSKQLASEFYNNVGLMSVGIEQKKYFDYFNPRNPKSPINLYGDQSRVVVKVKGISFITPNIALVRYLKTVESDNQASQTTHWAATIAFQYSAGAMSERDRLVNPLGFQVTEYRNDPDEQVTGAEIDNSSTQPNITTVPAVGRPVVGRIAP